MNRASGRGLHRRRAGRGQADRRHASM